MSLNMVFPPIDEVEQKIKEGIELDPNDVDNLCLQMTDLVGVEFTPQELVDWLWEIIDLSIPEHRTVGRTIFKGEIPHIVELIVGPGEFHTAAHRYFYSR